MPIIRYRTRDLTRLLPGTSRPMRRIDKITGHSDDMMIIRGVNVFPTQIEEQILAIDGLSPHYQIELFKQGNLDSVKVNCEVLNNDVNVDEASRQLQKRIKDMTGISTQINLVEQGGVPRSQGKAQRVIDKR